MYVRGVHVLAHSAETFTDLRLLATNRECFHSTHIVTRRECLAEARQAWLDYLCDCSRQQGQLIVPTSKLKMFMNISRD